jgi:hypothetical protein
MARMSKDRYFAKGTSHVEFRFSAASHDYVVLSDKRPELVTGVPDEIEYVVGQRVAALTKKGYKPAKQPTLPDVLTPDCIEAITGLAVPAGYRKFLAAGKHTRRSKTAMYQGYLPAAGIVTKVPGFADSPIVFDDPVIPFWLVKYGWNEQAPTAIPIGLFEEGRAMVIDAKTGVVYAYDNSATRPLMQVAKTLDGLVKLVRA